MRCTTPGDWARANGGAVTVHQIAAAHPAARSTRQEVSRVSARACEAASLIRSEATRSAGIAPLGGFIASSSHARALGLARFSFDEPANRQMEPTRPTVCAILSLRRAAHLER